MSVPSGEAPLGLARGTVHVWHMDAAPLDAGAAVLAALLDDDERARAGRLLHRDDASAFIVSHAVARLLLARYLGCAPQDIRYRHGMMGKPYVLAPTAPAPLWFNASRSRSVCVFAFSADGEIGIDVEEVAALPPPQIISRALATRERKMLPMQDGIRFFEFWARKEAFLKARGDGFSLPATEIDTSDIAAIRIGDEVQSQWWLQDLSLHAAYAAAVSGEKAGMQNPPLLHISTLGKDDLIL